MKKVIDSITGALNVAGDAIDKNITSKEELLEKMNVVKVKLIEAQRVIRLADAQGN